MDRSQSNEASVWPSGSLLARLTPPTREVLLALGVPRTYRAGQVLIHEGDATTHVVLIRKGHVKITAATADRGNVLLAIRPPGDIVGEWAALHGVPRSATATAPVEVAGSQVSRPELLAFHRRHPDAALAVNGMVGDRLRMANRRRLDISGATAAARIARILAELADRFGRDVPGGRLIDVITQPELADLAGVSDITAQRALRELRTAGLIETGYGRITIVRPRTLDELSRVEWPDSVI